MQSSTTSATPEIIKASVEAIKRGYHVIHLAPMSKSPRTPGWPHWRWAGGDKSAMELITADEVQQQFEEWAKHSRVDDLDELNLGVLLGEASGNLVDVDLDHYRTARLKDYFLPPTPARSGRVGKPNSHYWYVCEEGTLPGTRQHLMPRMEQPDGTFKKGPVIVELRSTGAQTALPPSTHPSGEKYVWTGDKKGWGGKGKGPMVVNGRRLATQVALLGLACVLLEFWPTEGSRHEAYLALAGGLLRDGDASVHPFWERNASVLIRALADATLDEDGPDAREQESIKSTIDNLNAGKQVTGFGKLGEILGVEAVKQIRILIGEVESAAGVPSRQATAPAQQVDVVGDVDQAIADRDAQIGSLKPDERDPLDERVVSWEPVDLEPYLAGQLKPVEPTILQRDDGKSLIYPGRVNMLFGSSESAKSWIALFTCIQEMAKGQRAMYLDFEDEPVNTLDRLKRMGAGADDLRFLFSYVRPEDALSAMQRDRWGNISVSPLGQKNQEVFDKAVERIDPTLIVADGMTVLYSLHGLDSNDAVSTDIITTWLKKLTRNGRTTVIIIDHTGKGAEKGTQPIGAHHKMAMVQGTMIQVWPTKQPMPDARGEVELIVLKDRPGQVRKISQTQGSTGKVQLAATVIVDSTVKDITRMSIQAPPDPATDAQKRAADTARVEGQRREEEAVLKCFGDELGRRLPLTAILQGCGLQKDSSGYWPKDEAKRWTEAAQRLIDKGYLYTEGKTKGFRYVLAVSDADSSGDLDLDLSKAGGDD